MKTTISITGVNINDLFNLSCVKGIHKACKENLAVELDPEQIERGSETMAVRGDSLILKGNGKWIVKRHSD